MNNNDFKKEVFQAIRINDINNYFFLIEKVDINIVNETNENLLQTALAYNREEIALDLIRKGINLNHKNNDGKTSLHYILNKTQLNIAKQILDKGGDIKLIDKYGNNPLWTATFNARGEYDLVGLYLNYGGNPNHKNINDKSPIDFAKQIKDNNLLEILESIK